MTPTRLAIELATQYDVTTRTAAEAVDTYASQLQDDDLYNTETGTLTDAGAEVIRAQFADDHSGQSIPGSTAAALDEMRVDIQSLTERAGALRAEADEMTGQRDALIRRAVAAGVRVADIADAAGIKPARVYQIRDGRR